MDNLGSKSESPGLEGNVAKLTQLLESRDPDDRVSAADALGATEQQEAVPYLIAKLQRDGSGAVRRAAAEALGRLQYAAGAHPLAQALPNEKTALARVCIAEALGYLGVKSPEVIDALTTAVQQDRSTLVRAYAAESLGRLGMPDDGRAVRARLKVERSTRARASMLESLSRTGDEKALRALLGMLFRVKDWAIRTAILNMLRYLREDVDDPRYPYLISSAIEQLSRREPDLLTAEHQWWSSFSSNLAQQQGNALG